MAKVPITVMGYRCDRCEHEWIPRGESEDEPRVCPKCKSPYWNRPRKSTPLTYERFSGIVRDALRAKSPMTWTEIRTTAKLPQAFPNNVWVHRMEADIGLVRERDTNGIIQWRLSDMEAVSEPNPPARVTNRSRKRPTPKQGTLE